MSGADYWAEVDAELRDRWGVPASRRAAEVAAYRAGFARDWPEFAAPTWRTAAGVAAEIAAGVGGPF